MKDIAAAMGLKNDDVAKTTKRRCMKRFEDVARENLAVIDILIGFSYAFHVCCWIKQTRLHQTDITGPGVVRSLLVITLFHILNLCLVILTPSSGVELALKRVFWEFPAQFVTGLLG